MSCVTNGNKAPFSEESTGYQIYQVLELMSNRKPMSEKKYTDWIVLLTTHARERLPEIIREAKQHKCYVL